jgi:hypothetical protein
MQRVQSTLHSGYVPFFIFRPPTLPLWIGKPAGPRYHQLPYYSYTGSRPQAEPRNTTTSPSPQIKQFLSASFHRNQEKFCPYSIQHFRSPLLVSGVFRAKHWTDRKILQPAYKSRQFHLIPSLHHCHASRSCVFHVHHFVSFTLILQRRKGRQESHSNPGPHSLHERCYEELGSYSRSEPPLPLHWCLP